MTVVVLAWAQRVLEACRRQRRGGREPGRHGETVLPILNPIDPWGGEAGCPLPPTLFPLLPQYRIIRDLHSVSGYAIIWP